MSPIRQNVVFNSYLWSLWFTSRKIHRPSWKVLCDSSQSVQKDVSMSNEATAVSFLIVCNALFTCHLVTGRNRRWSKGGMNKYNKLPFSYNLYSFYWSLLCQRMFTSQAIWNLIQMVTCIREVQILRWKPIYWAFPCSVKVQRSRCLKNSSYYAKSLVFKQFLI